MHRLALRVIVILGCTAATACGPFAYITHGGTVSSVNTFFNLLVDTINVGGTLLGVAVTPDGSEVYVAGFDPGNLSNFPCVRVIETATGTTSAPICLEDNTALVSGSIAVAIHPSEARAYVTTVHIVDLVSPMTRFWTLSVIDTVTRVEIDRVPIGDPVTTTLDVVFAGLDLAPDGSRVFVANPDLDAVFVVDTQTNNVTTTPVGSRPTGVAVTPDGSHLYVTNNASDTVSVVSTATHTVVATIPIGPSPRGVAIHPAGITAYVASGLERGTVSVIETAANQVVATIPVGQNPWGIAVTLGNPFGSGPLAYVANSGSGTVSVIDATTNAVVDTVTVGGSPIAFGKFIGPVTLPTAMARSQ